MAKEESVQFSLKELLSIEEERLVRQAREKEAREIQAARDREENERQRAFEAIERARAEVAEAERRRRADLDELARREAMQKAVVEQARIEVEARARAEERDLERRHEIELVRLRRESAANRVGGLVAAVAFGGAVMLLVAVAVHLGVTAPEARRRLALADDHAAASDQRVSELERQLDEARAGKRSVEGRLAVAEAEIGRLKVEPKAPPPARGGPRGPGKPHVERPSTETCAKGDPLCPTIPLSSGK